MKGTNAGKAKRYIVPVVVLLALAVGFVSAGFWFTRVAGRRTEVTSVMESAADAK